MIWCSGDITIPPPATIPWHESTNLQIRHLQSTDHIRSDVFQSEPQIGFARHRFLCNSEGRLVFLLLIIFLLLLLLLSARPRGDPDSLKVQWLAATGIAPG